MSIDAVQYVTTAFASIGAVLGVINTWNLLDRQSVKLLVRPAVGWQTPNFDRAMLTIDVINMSAFPVTISAIGFERKDGNRYVKLDQHLTNGKDLPYRLESRESISAFFPFEALDPTSITVAFAQTACGEKAVGDSPALAQARSGAVRRLLDKQ